MKNLPGIFHYTKNLKIDDEKLPREVFTVVKIRESCAIIKISFLDVGNFSFMSVKLKRGGGGREIKHQNR